MILPAVLAPLAEFVPVDEAMGRLAVPMTGNAAPEAVAWVEALDASPHLVTLAWLYLDELDRAHAVCMDLPDGTGSALHAIVHRREGDFWNSLYWWRRAGNHPALVEQDPEALVRAAEVGESAAVILQREEWSALAHWCAEHT